MEGWCWGCGKTFIMQLPFIDLATGEREADSRAVGLQCGCGCGCLAQQES